MKLHISEILAGSSVVKTYTVSPSFDTLVLRQGSYPVSRKEDFVLTVSKEEEVLRVQGETNLDLLMPCDRCLEDVTVHFPLHFDYSWKKDQTGDETEDAEEIPFVEGGWLDVDRLVTDELVVALPTKVLCREDCKGLCSVCGKNLNYGTCDCDRKVPDPRMAAIRDIFLNSQ